ncbi:MAG: hypothetical protein JNL11_08800 [Bdellovibrionaceae bacterium]|nr:hypothetical protein [Pseudobdellovibrionaceae bacterium]
MKILFITVVSVLFMCKLALSMGLPAVSKSNLVNDTVYENGRNFCEMGRYLCEKMTGNSVCRMSSDLSYSEKIDSIYDWYKKFLASDEALSLCCKDNQACSKYLQSVPLVISRDPVVRQMLAGYSFFNTQLLLSDIAVMRCTSLECIQEIILHEMGHACQAAAFESQKNIISKNWNRLQRVIRVTGGGLLTSGTAGYSASIGPKRLACIQLALKKAGEGREHNEMSWLREALADAIFAPMKKSPIYWRQSCSVPADDLHADRGDYLHCLFIKD